MCFCSTTETPTGDETEEDESSDSNFEESSDLFSGAKEMEAYQQSLAVKKSIQFNLGRRSGPRWSLPHEYIGESWRRTWGDRWGDGQGGGGGKDEELEN